MTTSNSYSGPTERSKSTTRLMPKACSFIRRAWVKAAIHRFAQPRRRCRLPVEDARRCEVEAISLIQLRRISKTATTSGSRPITEHAGHPLTRPQKPSRGCKSARHPQIASCLPFRPGDQRPKLLRAVRVGGGHMGLRRDGRLRDRRPTRATR